MCKSTNSVKFTGLENFNRAPISESSCTTQSTAVALSSIYTKARKKHLCRGACRFSIAAPRKVTGVKIRFRVFGPGGGAMSQPKCRQGHQKSEGLSSSMLVRLKTKDAAGLRMQLV